MDDESSLYAGEAMKRIVAIAVAAFLMGSLTGSAVAGTALAPITLQPGQQVTIIAATPTPKPTWTAVVNDQFNSGGLPTHWFAYDGVPIGMVPNCAIPSHATVSGGYLHMTLSYEATGWCGAGWYTAGLRLQGLASVDSRITVRFRVVDTGGVGGHFVIPFKYPNVDATWPAAGEEDYCEGDDVLGCNSYLHYGASNSQIVQHYTVDLTQWHTMRFQRLNHVVTAYIDNMTTPVWTYNGTSTTLPDTLKLVILQTECHAWGCPAGTTGSEDVQIDWITVENPTP
jgi:hypothetical protein